MTSPGSTAPGAPRSAASIAKDLALASHLAPTLAVTVFGLILGVLAGDRPSTVVILGAAVFCGQLSIGWSNDRIDARRDSHVGRVDKPIATGALATATVDIAIAAALVATITFSLLLGWRAGLLHLFAVACGWAYNLGLKGTRLSWLPYAIAFGLLPGVATLARTHPVWPPTWLIGAGACLGTVANLTNALPDVEDDERTGIRGAPHRLGAKRCVVISSILLLVSTVLIVFGPVGSPDAIGYLGLGVAVVLASAGCAWALNHPHARATFYGLFVFVALQLILIATTTHHLR